MTTYYSLFFGGKSRNIPGSVPEILPDFLSLIENVFKDINPMMVHRDLCKNISNNEAELMAIIDTILKDYQAFPNLLHNDVKQLCLAIDQRYLCAYGDKISFLLETKHEALKGAQELLTLLQTTFRETAAARKALTGEASTAQYNLTIHHTASP